MKAGIAAGVLTAAGVAVALVLAAGGGHTATARGEGGTVLGAGRARSPSPQPRAHRTPPVRPAPPTHSDSPTSVPHQREQRVQAASRSEQPAPARNRRNRHLLLSPHRRPRPRSIRCTCWPGRLPGGRPAAGTRRRCVPAASAACGSATASASAGRTYAHGVTVPAPSSVTIDLPRACTAFDALAGLDDLAPRSGTVGFAVYGDGKRLWSSAPLRGGRPAVPVHVPLERRVHAAADDDAARAAGGDGCRGLGVVADQLPTDRLPGRRRHGDEQRRRWGERHHVAACRTASASASACAATSRTRRSSRCRGRSRAGQQGSHAPPAEGNGLPPRVPYFRRIQDQMPHRPLPPDGARSRTAVCGRAVTGRVTEALLWGSFGAHYCRRVLVYGKPAAGPRHAAAGRRGVGARPGWASAVGAPRGAGPGRPVVHGLGGAGRLVRTDEP